MEEKTYQTPCGTIHYWTNVSHPDEITLVFLPGLTADHRLFDKQIQHFKEKYNIVVWDAPAHAASWPFRFDFDLFDKAKWLDDILNQEGLTKPVIVGQSMGGYVGQAYAQLYPNRLAGFVSIDSAPLQTSVYKGYKRDKIEMRVDRVEVSDFPLYLNTVAGGLDRRDQTIGGFSFVVKIYAVPVVEIIG